MLLSRGLGFSSLEYHHSVTVKAFSRKGQKVSLKQNEMKSPIGLYFCGLFWSNVHEHRINFSQTNSAVPVCGLNFYAWVGNKVIMSMFSVTEGKGPK